MSKYPAKEGKARKDANRRGIAHALAARRRSFLYDLSESEFRKRFGIDDEERLNEYWRRMSSEAWFRSHPDRFNILAAPHRHVPMRIHGNDARYSRRSEILVINMSGVLCRLQTIMSRMLLAWFAMVFALGAETFELFV